MSINSHVFVGNDSQQAADVFFPAYVSGVVPHAMMRHIELLGTHVAPVVRREVAARASAAPAAPHSG